MESLHNENNIQRNEKKYYKVSKRYLAEALGYIGFRYYKFNDDGKIVYSFEDNENFQSALKQLIDLRQKYNVINK